MWEAEAQATAPLALLDERGGLPSSLSLSELRWIIELDYYERRLPEIPNFGLLRGNIIRNPSKPIFQKYIF